jgi:phosphoribosylanthranilate isomerase
MRDLFVKICGITNLDDALLSVEAGADAVGFIFYDQSPRAVKPLVVRRIVEYLPGHVTKVGVFVHAAPKDVAAICREVRLSAAQLYGKQSQTELRELETGVIKAFQVGKGFDVRILSRYRVDAFLLDTLVKGKSGGTGKTFDWNIARRATKYGKVILSGGLNPDNVSEAVRFVRPYGVDVCSGVEARPGKKDSKKVREFIQRAKTSLR